MDFIGRRHFLKVAATLSAAGLAPSCGQKPKTTYSHSITLLKKDPQAMALSRAMSREDLYAMLDSRVRLIMGKCHNCAQSTFYVLSEQFGLGGGDILKALTPMPGIAERGETCGAITGSLMAMGLIYGRDRLDDWDTYRKAMIPTGWFCEQFEKEFGTTLCRKIQNEVFGKCFNLMNPDELHEFQLADATEKCGGVVSKAVKMATDIILEEKT